MRGDLARALLDAIDDDALELLAERLAPRLMGRLAQSEAREDRWLDSKRAAEYLGITPNALYKLTAAREVPFEQDGPGCKCWFRQSELDAWRQGNWRRNGAVALARASKTLPNGADSAGVPGAGQRKTHAWAGLS
jgi:hypothetical protein